MPIPKLLFCDLVTLEAVDSEGRRHPLEPMPGKDCLCWQPVPGAVEETRIPKRFHQKKMEKLALMKKPASSKKPTSRKKPTSSKKPASADDDCDDDCETHEDGQEEADDTNKVLEDEEEEEAEQEEDEEEAQQEEEDEEEAHQDEEEDEEEAQEEKDEDEEEAQEEEAEQEEEEDRKEAQALRKRPAAIGERVVEVDTICLVQAHKGKLRCYILAKVKFKKVHVATIAETESRKYHTLTTKLYNESLQKVEEGITLDSLRCFAARRKAELLS